MTLSAKGRKAKGDRFEREVVALIAEHTGIECRRGKAGHSEDQGDVHGLPHVTIQCKDYVDVTRAVNEGLQRLAEQRTRNTDPFGACFVRRRGGRPFVAMEPEGFFALLREAWASMPHSA